LALRLSRTKPAGWRRDRLLRFASWLVAMAVLLLLVLPVLQLLLLSFSVTGADGATRFGLSHWRDAFAEPQVASSILNTLSLSIGRQSISLLVGVFVAWLIARTNLPGRHILEIGFWLALFMPLLPATLAWILIAGGSNGMLNKLLAFSPAIASHLTVYSWWGIVWVHLFTSSIAIKVFLLVPAFKALDSSFEEAARMSGASVLQTYARVALPLMMPVVLAVLAIGMIRSLQSFEVELVLGGPAGIEVLSTIIYRSMTQEPPLTGMSASLSMIFLFILIPIILYHRRLSSLRSSTTMSGAFSYRISDLGKMRWPLFGFVFGLLSLMTIVPLLVILGGTFMRIFGSLDLDDLWTLDHWRVALQRGDLLPSLFNTLSLGLSAALIGMVLFTALALFSLRWRSRGRAAVEAAIWAPAVVPGVTLSLGLLLCFSGYAWLRPIYATMAALVIAILFTTLTLGTQLLREGTRQLHRDLEAAAASCGAGPWYRMRRILLPLLLPLIALVGLEIFAAANTAVGAISLLASGDTQPLSLLQLNLLNSGQFEVASVVGILMMLLSAAAALLARRIGQRHLYPVHAF
jgi:iron(III) transport system permease protein